MNSEEVPTREALTRPDRTCISIESRENSQVEALRSTLKNLVRNELLDVAKGS